ncbi:MAG: hypothetical protein MI723_14215 [Caulobacterales bacterium]|nr:hypothetical protein [Caulobacterales bacterium]
MSVEFRTEDEINDIVATIRMLRYLERVTRSLDPPAEETASLIREAIDEACDYARSRLNAPGLNALGMH